MLKNTVVKGTILPTFAIMYIVYPTFSRITIILSATPFLKTENVNKKNKTIGIQKNIMNTQTTLDSDII